LVKINPREQKDDRATGCRRGGYFAGVFDNIGNGQRGVNLPAKTAKAIARVLEFSWTKFYDDNEEEGTQ